MSETNYKKIQKITKYEIIFLKNISKINIYTKVPFGVKSRDCKLPL